MDFIHTILADLKANIERIDAEYASNPSNELNRLKGHIALAVKNFDPEYAKNSFQNVLPKVGGINKDKIKERDKKKRLNQASATDQDAVAEFEAIEATQKISELSGLVKQQNAITEKNLEIFNSLKSRSVEQIISMHKTGNEIMQILKLFGQKPEAPAGEKTALAKQLFDFLKDASSDEKV